MLIPTQINNPLAPNVLIKSNGKHINSFLCGAFNNITMFTHIFENVRLVGGWQ